MQFRISYIMGLLVVLLAFTFDWWAKDEGGDVKGNYIVTMVVGIAAIYLSVFSVMQSLNETDYKTCLSYLEVIEHDLTRIDFMPIFQSTPLLYSKLTTKQHNELNGMEFQHFYMAFWNFINNEPDYKEHLRNKDDIMMYNIYHKIIDVYYYMLNKQNYSFNEIAVVIKITEESEMTWMQKKFIYRKIRRICLRYYDIMKTKKQGHGGMIATEENDITEYMYDIPFYEIVKEGQREVWRKTSLFKTYEYDKLYKVLVYYKTIGKGFNVAEERHH